MNDNKNTYPIDIGNEVPINHNSIYADEKTQDYSNNIINTVANKPLFQNEKGYYDEDEEESFSEEVEKKNKFTF